MLSVLSNDQHKSSWRCQPPRVVCSSGLLKFKFITEEDGGKSRRSTLGLN